MPFGESDENFNEYSSKPFFGKVNFSGMGISRRDFSPFVQFNLLLFSKLYITEEYMQKFSLEFFFVKKYQQSLIRV